MEFIVFSSGESSYLISFFYIYMVHAPLERFIRHVALLSCIFGDLYINIHLFTSDVDLLHRVVGDLQV